MNFVKKNKSKNLSGFFAALSLYSPSINYCLSEHLGYTFTNVATGGLMFIFAFVALACGMMKNIKGSAFKYTQLFAFVLLMAISVIWFGNYLVEYHSGNYLSNYDIKRPLFYVYGVLCFGAIGALASADPYNFLREFFKTSVLAATVLCLLYLALFDQSVELARIGGDAGLIIGILISQGGAALIAGYGLNFFKGNTLICLMPVFIMSVVLSGTRSALIALILCILIFMAGRSIKSNGKTIAGLIFVIILSIIFVSFAIMAVPEQFIQRISNFNLEGSEDRVALLILAYEIFESNILGKVTGFSEYFPADIEYSHNSTVQILLEIGVIGLLLFLLLISGVVISLLRIAENKGKYTLRKSILYYALNVFLVSLSAGSAYDPQYWMVLTLFSSMGFGAMGFKIDARGNRSKKSNAYSIDLRRSPLC